MNLFYTLYYFMSLPNTIKNVNYPICKNCVHFLQNQGNDEFSKCKMFGEKNLINGEIVYSYADMCRNIEKRCNITGKYYEEKRQ